MSYKAQQMGYHPDVILAGRRINDTMGKYVAENTVKQLIKADKQIKGARVYIMGLTFKEDVPDTRNTKVLDVISELQEYGIDVLVSDNVADEDEVLAQHGVSLLEYDEVKNVDAVVLAVCHSEYKKISLDMLKDKYSDGMKVLVDVKSMYSQKDAEEKGYLYWSL